MLPDYRKAAAVTLEILPVWFNEQISAACRLSLILSGLSLVYRNFAALPGAEFRLLGRLASLRERGKSDITASLAGWQEFVFCRVWFGVGV